MTDRTDAPPPGAQWRLAAKALVVDATGRVLLLRMTDPSVPDCEQWWELPGGGVEAGESVEDAVVREVAEETGMLVAHSSVRPALWTRRATFRWMGRRHWQEETVSVVRADESAQQVGTSPTDDEAASVLEVAWVRLGDLAGLRTYPGRLAELAPRILAGEAVAEGFERWN